MAEAVNAVRTQSLQVPLRGIPDALRSLWDLCRPAQADETLSRALTVNLLAVAPFAEAAGLRDTVTQLLRRLPCRAFLVLFDPERRELCADVQGATRSAGKAREIVLEQIELRVGPDGLAAVPGVIRPLLVNDIPTHLFWQDALPRNGDGLEQLLPLCDHAVVDSARFLDPETDLAGIRFLRTGHRRITDLSWLRARPWRRALAQAFELVPFDPATPTRVVLRHGLNPGALACSHLLATWLEERLQATVELQSGEADERPTPELLELWHGDEHVAVQRTDGHLRVTVTRKDVCLLPFQVPASRGGCADLLAAAIDLA